MGIEVVGAPGLDLPVTVTLLPNAADTLSKLNVKLPAGGYKIINNAELRYDISLLSGSKSVFYINRNLKEEYFSISEPADNIIFSLSTVDVVQLEYIGPSELSTSPSFSATVTEIDSTTSGVTVSKDSAVVLIGGGGKGGDAYRSNNGNVATNGGGSGYMAKGFIPAGTYDIVIGGQGGTTVISEAGGASILSAEGGENAPNRDNSGTNAGSVNAGSLPGAAGGSGGSRGFNGNNGNGNPSGVGSGITFASGLGLPLSLYKNVQNSQTGTPTNNTTNNHRSFGGGIYAGGGEGSFTENFISQNGQPGTGFGGGGGGGCSNAFGGVVNSSLGGSGASGVAWILEVS